MSIFNEFPYTSMHELNLDWIIARVKEWLATAENWEKWKNDTDQAIKDLKDYLDNLDLQEEVNNKLDEMVADGTLAEIINQEIFGELNDKVEELEYFQRIYTNWEGWNTFLTQDGFLAAGIVKTYTVNNKNSFASSLPNRYSEVKELAAPTPIVAANIGATCDSGGAWISDVNLVDSSRIRFRIWFPDDYDTPYTINVRINLITTIKAAPLNTSLPYNAANAEQLIEIANSYLNARVDGRAFGYGRNFFYDSQPNNIINNANGQAMMECDTFVGLCLRGIPYNKSPYVNTTPNFTYNYSDLYTDVSGATEWAASQSYNVGDIIHISNQLSEYWECTTAHTSGSAFDNVYWKSIWIVNPNGYNWSNTLNGLMHPANSYLGRDIKYAPDYGFMAWGMSAAVFRNKEIVRTGDIAFWVRRSHKRRYYGGYGQSPGFDNIGHVGIVSIENGTRYLYHVSSANATDGLIVQKRPLDEMSEQPDYFARLV